MTRRQLTTLAAAGSAALLLGAFFFQMLGYAPCKMCLWQRWPHGAAAFLGLVAYMAPIAAVIYLGALSALTTSGLGFFHAGVEQGWWEGPQSCSSGSIADLSADELFDQIMSAPLVRCDEIAWSFLNVSMAAWNGILSLGLAAIWLLALRARS